MNDGEEMMDRKYLVLMFIRYHKISFKRKYKNNYTMPFIYVCVQKRAKLNRISLVILLNICVFTMVV